jgi:hypothetical protein
VDDQQAARLLLIVFATPLVLFFFGGHLGKMSEFRVQSPEDFPFLIFHLPLLFEGKRVLTEICLGFRFENGK